LRRGINYSRNEETGESNENISSNSVIRVRFRYRSNDDLTDKHGSSTNEEDWTATSPINEVDTRERSGDIDGSEDDLEDVGVGKTGRLGELDTV
jgi:hypothetical protein